MRKHISFSGMATAIDNHDGACAAMHNIIAEDGALRPIGITTQQTASIGDGQQVVALHQGDNYCHLIIQQLNDNGSCDYLWTDEHNGEPAPLLTHTAQFNDYTTQGDILCLVADDNRVLAVWRQQEGQYRIIRREDLLYDITVTQDQQERVTVTTPITQAVEKMLQDQGQGAAKAWEMVDRAIDQARAPRGEGCFKHVCLAVAAPRMADGSHILVSNIFALIPADMTTTISANYGDSTLCSMTWLHRHAITIHARDTTAFDTALVTAIDIFISQPLHFIDTDNVHITTDQEGRTTGMTFGHLSRRNTLQVIDNVSFHHAMTVTRQLLDTPMAMHDIAPHSKPLDLTDFRRSSMGAKRAWSHDHRLSLGNVAQVMHNPLEIGIHYVFPSLTTEQRLLMTPEEREVALAGEGLGGSRPDIDDNPDGQTAGIVVKGFTDDAHNNEVWWAGQVQYPIPGMMMWPGGHLYEMEYHIRMTQDGACRCFTTRQTLEACHDKGVAIAVHTPSSLPHRVARPPFLSILLQQARVTAYDATTGAYRTSYLLWEEESEDDYLRHLAQAREAWTMTRQQGLLCTSEQHNTLVFPTACTVTVGEGRLLHLQANTRRTADGLFGDGQYYAFTDKGVWVLRLYGGRWQARQAVTRLAIMEGCKPAAISDAVVFMASRGVMLLKGSSCTCISDTLPTDASPHMALPRINEVMATEPALDALTTNDWTFHPEEIATIAYDPANEHLWLFRNGSRPKPVWVYSIKAKTWATATSDCTQVVSQGGLLWGRCQVDGTTGISRLTFGIQGRQTVFLCTQPMAWGDPYTGKTMQRLIIRGRFTDSGRHTDRRREGSHIGMAIYGSHDGIHAHLIATTDSIYLQQCNGAPHPWHAIAVIGRLLPTENIEGASIEYKNRHDKHIR